jgi:DNA-binding MarR family transcriptional regulator
MDPLPLPALLSQTLVAFIIEFDNEAEHRMPHRTTRHGSTDAHAPWLVSMAMWENCMKPLGDEEITIRELVRRARAVTKFVGMKRWGYIAIRPDPSGSKSSADKLVRATPAGRKAQEIWQPLTDVIEHRWQDRFGKREISNLRESLSAVESQLEIELPDCLPILGYGLFSKGRRYKPRTANRSPNKPHLSAALSRILLAFALEFESESDLSLAISANVLRVLSEKRVRLRDLPRLTGVSKEAISMAMGILRKQRLAAIEPDPAGGKFRLVRLTASGARRKTRIASLCRRSNKAGSPALAKIKSTTFEVHWRNWSATGLPIPRHFSVVLSPIPVAGAPRSQSPKPCPTILWFCIAADFPMAVERLPAIP